jgi:hypothetical protein
MSMISVRAGAGVVIEEVEQIPRGPEADAGPVNGVVPAAVHDVRFQRQVREPFFADPAIKAASDSALSDKCKVKSCSSEAMPGVRAGTFLTWSASSLCRSMPGRGGRNGGKALVPAWRTHTEAQPGRPDRGGGQHRGSAAPDRLPPCRRPSAWRSTTRWLTAVSQLDRLLHHCHVVVHSRVLIA